MHDGAIPMTGELIDMIEINESLSSEMLLKTTTWDTYTVGTTVALQYLI